VLRSSSQVSTSEDTAVALDSPCPSWVNVVITAVTPRPLSMSICRATAELTALDMPRWFRLAIASSTASDGDTSSSNRCNCTRCSSNPYAVERTAHTRSSPASTQRRRSTPIERMLRSS